MAGCAGHEGPAGTDDAVRVDGSDPPQAEPPADRSPGPAATDGAATQSPDDQPLLDRTQQTVFTVVNSTSQWFDGFFGSASLDTDTDEQIDVTRGLLAVGTRWDERDDFDTRVRFRAQFPLRALKRRTRLLLGRGDTDDLVDGSETETINTLPDQFSDFTEDDWLLGLGYRRQGGMSNGFDFGVGASIRSDGLDPYVRATYRYNKAFGDSVLWRLRPRVFWQEERGEGTSLTSILDAVANDTWLLRSWVTLTTEQEVQGLGWDADFLAYQSISDRVALSYRLFATGETDSPVEIEDYGVEFRFRRRISRDWLFLELSTGVSWPREELTEVRDSNLSIGVELEMQFGDWPGRKQKRPVADDAAQQCPRP